ncbi:MAG: hypothetical protein Kow0031_26880 [Anaerolineae bacterium]
MSNSSKIMLLGLLAAAVFVIFNCAGYLAITLLLPEPVTGGPAADSAAVSQAEVVAFSTTTPAPLLSADGEIPTPAPLLPTVTPGGPPPTAVPPAAPPATRPPLTPVQTSPQVTAAPGDLVVVSHQSYVDSLGWYHIVGEVQNNAGTPMEYVEVIAKLYNAEKEVIGTKLTFTAPDVIAPGASAPFDIIALRQAQWEQIESYSLQVKGDVSTNTTPQDLVLVSQSGQIENDLLVVGGQVQNVGDAPVLAKLIVTLYDSDLNVINTSWSYADEGIIPANGVSGFEVKVLHKTDPNNFSYRIQIEEEAVND